MLFSDNVSIKDELYLKKKAKEKGLLVMGPDCGPDILSHVIGGPACKNKFSCIPGITSLAIPIPTRKGCAFKTFCTAS